MNGVQSFNEIPKKTRENRSYAERVHLPLMDCRITLHPVRTFGASVDSALGVV